jgi:hypothetical protein
MSATEQGLTFRRETAPDWTPEQATAVARFHNRTDDRFCRVQDLSLIGQYSRLRGWEDIAQALLPATT